MKRTLLCCIVLLACFTVTAQQKKYVVNGVVKDSLTGKSIDFATVTITRNGNPEPLKSTYTTTGGKFRFSGIDTGTYEVVVSHTSYGSQKRQVILAAGKDQETLADIILPPSANILGDVVVAATKPLVEQTNDKLIYNVENDPSAKAETAIDILRKTPFVTVDGDNNIQVNGQSNFKVLLNGKETSMFTQNVKEALKGFPGAVITKIEVITSPSAKYDAEGVGGIINIITKKRVVGFNGSLGGYVNTGNSTGANASLNLKSGKLGISGYYGNNSANNIPTSTVTQTTPAVSSFYSKRTINGSGLMSYFYNYGNVELSWELDSLHTISVYGNISGGNNKSKQDQVITTNLTSPVSTSTNLYSSNSRYQYPSYDAGMDYIRKFKSNPEKEFDLKYFGEFSDNNSFINTSQMSSGGNRFVSNKNLAGNTQHTLEADYILPMGKDNKLEAGVKGIFRSATADFQSLITYDVTKPYTVDPANSNLFRYTQNILSAYASFNFKIKKYGLRLGSRLENTNIKGDFATTGGAVRQQYTNLIPNIQVTRKFSSSYTAVLSYTMRLQRPFITSLNPFVNNNDTLNISYGNPNLGPQTIHSVSLQHRILKGSTFMGITMIGSYSGNAIETYTSFDAAKGVISTTSANIGKEYTIGLVASISGKFSNAWRINVNGSANFNYAKNKFLYSQSNTGISGNGFVSNNITLGKFGMGFNGGFFASPVTIQTKRSVQYFYNAYGSYKFLDDKVSIVLSIQNFLSKEFTYRSTTTDPNFTTFSDFTNPLYRRASVSLYWNFGKLKESVSKKKGVVNDDLAPASTNGGSN